MAVGKGVAVGNNVLVAEGMVDAVGVSVGTEAGDEQEDKNESRKMKRIMDGVVLFRMA